MFKNSTAAMALLSSSPAYGLEPLVSTRAIGSGVRQYGKPRSRYMPHQGPREIARRLRQAARLAEQPA